MSTNHTFPKNTTVYVHPCGEGQAAYYQREGIPYKKVRLPGWQSWDDAVELQVSPAEFYMVMAQRESARAMRDRTLALCMAPDWVHPVLGPQGQRARKGGKLWDSLTGFVRRVVESAGLLS